MGKVLVRSCLYTPYSAHCLGVDILNVFYWTMLNTSITNLSYNSFPLKIGKPRVLPHVKEIKTTNVDLYLPPPFRIRYIRMNSLPSSKGSSKHFLVFIRVVEFDET